jgi:hypothetical protein
MNVTMEQFAEWLNRYFQAWHSNRASDVAGLFAEDAVYYYGPYAEPSVGRERIVTVWVADPDQQQKVRTVFTPLATAGPLGVAHWNVTFRPRNRPDVQVELDGILAITFDSRGRCIEHREWYHSRELTKAPE